ncbi:hypothetical protein M885DRAFT_164275 [Pelagophyceae sp. CCMP2097]|nr:hypothetical protein M885DRAFT_164275 [Pelagophyceae sp. CCMP2097]
MNAPVVKVDWKRRVAGPSSRQSRTRPNSRAWPPWRPASPLSRSRTGSRPKSYPCASTAVVTFLGEPARRSLPAFSFEAVAVERHHEASFAVAPSAVFGRGVEAASSGVAVLEPGEPPMYFDLAVVGEPAAAEAAAAGGPRLSKRGLNAWVKRHNAKLYTALGPRNFRALGRERSVATAIMPSSDQGSEFVGLSKELQAAARGAEAAVRDKMGFGELDGYRWKAFVATMGVREAQLPRLLVIDVDGDRRCPRHAPVGNPGQAVPGPRTESGVVRCCSPSPFH